MRILTSVTFFIMFISCTQKTTNHPTFTTLDTNFSKGRLIHQQEITIPDLEKFHGPLCDGLVVGALGIEQAMKELYPNQIIDRTNLRIVSKPSPCLTDVAIYLTGARFQFNTFYINTDFKGIFIIQRIDNLKTILVSLNDGVIPDEIISLGNKAIQKELSPCELDSLKTMEDSFIEKNLKSDSKTLFTITEMTDFQWNPNLKNDYLKTDIINKNAQKCE